MNPRIVFCSWYFDVRWETAIYGGEGVICADELLFNRLAAFSAFFPGGFLA